jgi:hypothetical protein
MIPHTEVEPKLSLENTLWQSFAHFYHLDKSNAAFHCSAVRFSPITFRLAEHLWSFQNYHSNAALREVIFDLGEYVEDAGR